MLAPMVLVRGSSPSAIASSMREGIRRQAFEMPAPAGFRARVVAEALQRGLLGFLSTSSEHAVHGVVEGPAAALDAFFDWCLDHGVEDSVPAVIDVTGEDDQPISTFRDVDV